jgi:hypothetical protein
LEAEMGRISLRSGWANTSQDPISKITIAKWTGGVAQALHKHEALSLNPSSTKKRRLFNDGESAPFWAKNPC